MTQSSSPDLPRRVALPLLLVIVLAGFSLRTWNINFDQGLGTHPDERSNACFYAPSLRLPASWDEFWDPHRSPLNPLWDVNRGERRSFTYGHLPLYLGVGAGHLAEGFAWVAEDVGAPTAVVDIMARAGTSCDAIAVAGRLVIALLDTLTIVLVYLLGQRLGGRQGGRVLGLLAAAFYAFAAQAIQLSHFFTMDPASTTFTVLAVLGAVDMVRTRRLSAALVTGLGIGLAVASKFSALPLLALPVVAGVLAVYRAWQAGVVAAAAQPGADPGVKPQRLDGRVAFAAVAGVLVAWVVAGLAFFFTSPYAVLDWQNFVQATLVEQGAMVRGVADMPFTRQYRNTLPYVYFIQQQVQWGLGWALGLAALAGTGYAAFAAVRSLWRMVRSAWQGGDRLASAGLPALNRRLVDDSQLANLVLWTWVIPYFGLTGAFLAKFNRYMSPLLPFALLWAAWLVVALWRYGHGPQVVDDGETVVGGEVAPVRIAPARTWPRWLAGALATVALLGGIFWSLAYVNGVYNREHTWITASRWMYEHIPSGSKILWELWDDALPKTVPGEPGMDMGTTGLTNIDWSPYEEDTADKYLLLKQKLREADYVAYSSKRIYDSVDELPQRYPLTTLYYQAMRDGRLGFELAGEFTSPPQLFGVTFDDRHADESWSLYDHPQVSVYRKVRDLTDAEFDAIFDHVYEQAVPYYRGADSPLSPLFNALGLGSAPGSENSGLINRVIALLSGQSASSAAPAATPAERKSLMLPAPLSDLPVVDDYRWNKAASNDSVLAVVTWWLMLTLLGWLVWPLAFVVMAPLRDRGYFVSRTLGWLLGGWLLWLLVNLGVLKNLVAHAWISVGLLAFIGGFFAWRNRRALGTFLRRNWPMLLAGEAVFAVAFFCFIVIRLNNPDLWQPWFGGEKQMEFAFLNGILRSPTFPPVDPHFSGGYINYYYFGLYLVAYLAKLTGIYAEVVFNLTIATLFALTVINMFAVAYSAVKRDRRAENPLVVETTGDADEAGDAARDGQARRVENPPYAPLVDQPRERWTQGFLAALLAPILVTVIGNLDAFGQLVRNLAAVAPSPFESALPGLKALVDAGFGLQKVLVGQAQLPPYDFWGPSRVLTPTINEFPYWSYLFADLHPHIIGIPLAGLFLALVLVLIDDAGTDWRRHWRYALGLFALFALLLGSLAAVNLWELPTYFGLGVLALLVSQYRGRGRIRWWLTLGLALAYGATAYLLYWPFFRSFVNVGASGIGLLRAPDSVGLWLLIWGVFGFLFVSWTLFAATRPARPVIGADGRKVRPAGVERAVSLFFRRYERLPRAVYLHQRLVTNPRFLYLLLLALIPITLVLALAAALLGWGVLALCLLPLGLSVALLWRRGRAADAGAVFALLLGATGLALLTGTQVVYLKDFLDGSDYYRMNTLFKFFNQVWVLWAVMGAIALPRILDEWVAQRARANGEPVPRIGRIGRIAWASVAAVLIAVSFTYPFFGTPARLEQRMPGWRPAFGTLNGLDFMREGSYAWPDMNNLVELRYEYDALQWLLDHVRGNATIVESSEVEYYRAWGTRIASNTGLSGLKGMHEQEQRYPEDVGYRDGLHRELWTSLDVARTQQILDELQVDLVYVGQLERYLHPDGVRKFETMAAQGLLTPLYQNERVTVYVRPGRLQQDAAGVYTPVAQDQPA